MMSEQKKIDEIANALGELTINELSLLCTQLNEKWDIDPNIFNSSGKDSSVENIQDSSKTKFKVLIKDIGTDKIGTYKYLAPILGCNLLQTKTHLDTLPFTIKDELSKEEADNFAAQLKKDLATAVIEVQSEEQD
jgi:large subunit ribosomal protein L7/L12